MWGLQGLSLSTAWVSAPRRPGGAPGCLPGGPRATGAGHTNRQAPPGQLEVRAGGSGGLRLRQDPAPGPLTTGRVRPAGVFFSSGPRWRAARQLTVRALHSLGVGRAPVADKVLQELRCLMAQLDSYGGEWGLGRLHPARPAALTAALHPQAGPFRWPCSAGLPPTSPSRSSSASGSTTRILCSGPCWALLTTSWSSWGSQVCR